MRDYDNFSYILDQECKMDMLPKRYFNEMVTRIMPYKLDLDERLEVINCAYEHALHIDKQTGFVDALTEYYKVSDHILSLDDTIKVMKDYNDSNRYVTPQIK